MTKNTKQLNDITPELKEALKIEIENTVLKSLGAQDQNEAATILQNLRDGARSMDNKTRATSIKTITNLAGDITLKVFTQDIFTNKLLKDDSLLAAFNDGYLDFGNTKEYILEPLTGFTEYNSVEFIPNEITAIPVESQVINFYEADGVTLSPNSKKWVKELTIIERQLIQYFLSGKTYEFIIHKIERMAESLVIGQMNILLNFIATATPRKIINLDEDTEYTPKGATNAAEAWIKIFNIINDMCQANADYAYKSTTEIPRIANQSNLIIFGNIKVFQYLKNMKAFIYHSNLFQPIQDLTDNNFYVMPRKFIIGDNKTIIKTSKDYYLDTKTLIIMDKNESFKFIHLLNETADQFFAKNLAKAHFKHLWFTWGMLNWGKMCKVTSNNLMVDEAPTE